MNNKKRGLKSIICVLLSIIIAVATLPFSVVAGASTLEQMQTEIDSRLTSYNGRVTYSTDVYMGSKKVLPYYLNNIVYASTNTSTGYADISSSIKMRVSCPKTVIALYDGVKTPSFPVNVNSTLSNFVRVCGIVLTYEDQLYETTGPTNYKGCSNVWRSIAGTTSWHTPEDQETTMLLTSKRNDYQYDVYYTRAQNSIFDMTSSNTLSPRPYYIEDKFNASSNGYVSSNSNDTTFQFVTRSFDDSSKYEYPVRAPLGESATQYYIDYRPIINIADTVKNDYNKIKNDVSHYDESAVTRYYEAIIALTDLNITNEFAQVNDDNASSLVPSVSKKIQDISNEYTDALNNLGEEYINIDDAKEFVNNNYQNAGINYASQNVKFNNSNITNVTYSGQTYNFGKNLIYCSSTAEKSSDIGQNYVNSWVVMPKAVVMMYDGKSETSFPVKIGFGRGTSDSSYTGCNLQSVYLGGESSNSSSTASSAYYLGNASWLVSNAVASIAPTSWFSISQINGSLPATNTTGGGTNLSNQYGGMFNKIVLNNSLYAQNKKIEPTDGKVVTFYYRYYNANYDTLPHPASIYTKQYVLNIVPLNEALEKVKSQYEAKIGTYGESKYPKDKVDNYYKALYKLMTFNINQQFIGCSDSNAYQKTKECTDKIATIISDYDTAYKELEEQYTITFKNFDGEIVSEKQYSKGEIPTPPANTPIQKASNTSKYHYVFSWAEMKAASADLTYIERRTSVLCTLDDGEVIEEPTCTAVGKMQYICSVCNGIMYEDIEMLKHDFSKYVPQYENGTEYAQGLKHDLTCSVGGEIEFSETCTFELTSNNEDSIVYTCKVCDGTVIYNKKGYTITITQNGDVISSKVYYEDQIIDVPQLPESYNDMLGHHTFSWDNEPTAAYPTADATYNIRDTFTTHQMSEYIYNDDATVEDVYGTETSTCSICGHKSTRPCTIQHIPTRFSITGKIMVANSVLGAPSNIPVENATITVKGVEKAYTTNADGEYVIDDLEAGEYEITISTDSSIDRVIYASVSFDELGMEAVKRLDSIGLVVFDYNKDGIINTIDATLMTRQSVSKEKSRLFKALFNKAIKYDEIIL